MQHLHMQFIYKGSLSKEEEEDCKLEHIREKDSTKNNMKGMFLDVLSL